MKKPINGDELTIRYNGAVLKARCGEVVEFPAGGAGAAKFNIVSKVPFQRGSEAVLMEGQSEVPIKIERVTMMGHKPVNIVSISGIFDGISKRTG